MRRFLGQQLGAFVYKDPPLQIANHDLSETAGTFWTHTAGGTSTAATISGMDIAHGTFYAGAETIYWGDSNHDTFGQFGTFTYPSVISSVGAENAYYDYTAISNTSFRVNSDLRNDGINSWREVEIVDTNTVRTGKHLVKFDLTLHSGSLYAANGTTIAFRLMSRDGAGNASSVIKGTSVGSNSIEIEVFDDLEDPSSGGYAPRIFFSFTPDSLFDVTISNLEITTVGSGSVSKTHTYPSDGPKELFVSLPMVTPNFSEGVITETSNHYMDKTFIRGSSKVMEKLI